MTIDEAIKLIQGDIDNEDVEWDSPIGRAYKLSFEALKRCKRAREYASFIPVYPLEGEAEENQHIAENMKDYWKHQNSGAPASWEDE